MSLRLRIVLLIALVLLVSMVMGALVAGLESRATLSAELQAGLTGAQQTVRSAFEDLPRSDHPERDLHQLTATFDGNRHVRAALVDADGRNILASQPGRPQIAAPEWFRRLLGPPPRPAEIDTPASVHGFSGIRLTPVPDNDVADAWKAFIGVVAVLCGSAMAGLVLVYFAIGRALRPLNALSAALVRIGAGDYGGRVDETGPLELIGLQRGFNRMAGEIADTSARNRKLADQLFTIQEEERAEIARDLHDEFGPHLFAINVDAETLVQLGSADGQEAVVGQARSIQGAVRHMQREVRELLGRLRPTRPTVLGLTGAIEDLRRFWTSRRPDLVIEVDLRMDEAGIAEVLKDVAYRLVQEAINNAVRHGEPKAIRVSVFETAEHQLAVHIVDDGKGATKAPSSNGFGLIGMRERVQAVDGVLDFGPGPDTGWGVFATIPLIPAQTSPSEAFA